MAFTDETLNEIKERISMVELVGEYVQLKKSGSGYTGLCPFHGEKTPSFHVHAMRKMYHCFGCHKGGSPFKFLMEIDGLNFPEAVKKLAMRTGVTLEEADRRNAAPKDPEVKNRERLVEANEWAARYYHFLLTERPAYQPVLDYVRGRGLSDKTIKKFRIGVSPAGWNTLMNVMTKKGFNFQELLNSGLIGQKQGSPTEGYDRFRERLMFPITDAEGQVIAFGGRVLPGGDEKQGKYINSSESLLFSKRRVLYGLYENMRGIRKRGEAIVVEGYMDVVGLAETGVDNAIASMGTALTEDHCRVLKNLTRRVVTVFDPDAAGTRASKTSVSTLLAAGMFGRDLTLPDGMDPDEYAVANGAEKFYQLCADAPRQVTKLLKEIANQGALSEEDRSRILGELTPVLVASRNSNDRATLWDNISLVLRVSMESLKEIAESANRHQRPDPRNPQAANRPNNPPRPTVAPRKREDALTLEFLEGAIRWPEEFLSLPKDMWLGGIVEARLGEWLEKLHAARDTAEREPILDDIVDREENPRIVGAASEALIREKPDTASPVALRALAERLAQRKKELEIRAISAQVRLAQQMGNEQELMTLLTKQRALRSGQQTS